MPTTSFVVDTGAKKMRSTTADKVPTTTKRHGATIWIAPDRSLTWMFLCVCARVCAVCVR